MIRMKQLPKCVTSKALDRDYVHEQRIWPCLDRSGGKEVAHAIASLRNLRENLTNCSLLDGKVDLFVKFHEASLSIIVDNDDTLDHLGLTCTTEQGTLGTPHTVSELSNDAPKIRAEKS